MAKRKRGRPLLIPTDDQIKAVGALSVKGLPHAIIADALGISERTFQTWLARGRRATSGPFFHLLQNQKKAQAKLVADCLDRIRKVGMGDGDRLPQWQALAWVLERRFREHFALNRDETTKGGPGGGDQPLVIEKGPEVVLPPVEEEGKT